MDPIIEDSPDVGCLATSSSQTFGSYREISSCKSTGLATVHPEESKLECKAPGWSAEQGASKAQVSSRPQAESASLHAPSPRAQPKSPEPHISAHMYVCLMAQ